MPLPSRNRRESPPMMRAALWFVGLFALAVALALFAGNNQGMVSLFWPPYRVDISLNMALLALLGLLCCATPACAALPCLASCPSKRGAGASSKRSASCTPPSSAAWPTCKLAALCAPANQRASCWNTATACGTAMPPCRSIEPALHRPPAGRSTAPTPWKTQRARPALRPASGRHQPATQPLAQEVREGAPMRAARWALDDRNPQESLQRLAACPKGPPGARWRCASSSRPPVWRRTTPPPWKPPACWPSTAASPPASASSLIASLVGEEIRACHDTQQLEKLWRSLPTAEQHHPDIALPAVRQWIDLAGDATQARQWLLPLWEAYIQGQLPTYQAQRLFLALQHSLENLDGAWLKRIEQAQTHYPKKPCCNTWAAWPACSANCGARPAVAAPKPAPPAGHCPAGQLLAGAGHLGRAAQ